MSRWKQTALLEFNKLPQSPGIYVIYFGGLVSYIGSAVNLKARLNRYGFKNPLSQKHIVKEWGDVKTAIIKYRAQKSFGEYAMVEIRLISYLSPPNNRNKSTWIPRKTDVRACPKCQSKYWDVPREASNDQGR